MQYLKTEEQIALMRRAGLLLWQAHQVAAGMVRPGVATAAIDSAVEAFLIAKSAVPLFKGVLGKMPFPASTCISINEEVVHGIPGARRLCDGDIVSIDIGLKLNGWCADAAVTYPVGAVDPVSGRLLEVTEGALRLAIQLMGEKQRWSQVAKEMEQYVKSAGFSMVEELVGHSIGREMWEGLHVPNYWSRDYERSADFNLEPGVVLAVEPMVNAGTKHVRTLSDQWTIVTEDGLPSAHFEHTVAITRRGSLVLTAGPDGKAWATA